jgi:hypothetical protein
MSLKQAKGDDMGMQTKVWGPAGWIFLHSIAQNYPWKPSSTQKKNYYSFFKQVGNVLPCKYCRESYKQFMKEPGTILNNRILESRKSLIKWLYLIHNKVNEKLGVKDIPTLKEVFDRYESYRSKCTKTNNKNILRIPQKGCIDPLRGYRKKCVIRIENINEFGKVIRNTQFGKKKKKNILKKKEKNNNIKNKIKLVSIKKSTIKNKKYTAIFEINGRKKTTHFGFKGMSDYTRHKDPARKKRYSLRHSKDLNTKNPAKAGFLSMFILWNKPTLSASIADYRRRLLSFNRTGKFPIK